MSLLLVGAIAVTSLLCGSVTASAASSKTALLSTALSQVDSKADSSLGLGQDILALYNSSDDSGCLGFYRIGSEEIKAWRSSGKLKATKLTADDTLLKSSGCISDMTFAYGNYALFYSIADDVTTYHVVKYNKSKKTLTTIYSTKNFIGVSGDGSMSEFIWNQDTRKLQVRILNNKAKLVKKLTYDYSADDSYGCWNAFRCGNDKAYVSYYRESELDISSDGDIRGGNIIAIDKNGKTKTVSDFVSTEVVVGVNYVAFDHRPIDGISYVCLTSKNKDYDTFNLRYYTDEKSMDEADFYTICDFGTKIYGTKAIAAYKGGTNEDPVYKYVLVNISSNKRLSKVYDYMFTRNDGEMFCAVNSKGQRGFVDSKGKELAIFDAADCFAGNGKYAPVIKDGKIYLVDKNMKQISKTIKADEDSEVWTVGDELFSYRYGNKIYYMTTKK